MTYFEPALLDAMGAAYEAATRKLGARGEDRRLIARHIVRLAERGVTASDEMYRNAIRQFGQAPPPSVRDRAPAIVSDVFG